MRPLGVPALFLAVTLAYTYPLSRAPGSLAFDLGPDTRLFLWTLGWDVHALESRPLEIFDANLFHPEERTLAYSEHQIGSALLAAPWVWGTGNLVLAMNAVLLLSCFLSGLFAFYLARRLGLGLAASILTGLIFALSPPRFYRLGQLHLATVQWIPLALALLHRYARGGSARHLLLATLAFTLQALSGGQNALFLGLAALALVAYLWAFGELKPSGSLVRDGALAAALGAALNLPFVLPYLQVQRELGLARTLDEAEQWSPNWQSFLASPAHVHRWIGERLGFGTEVEREAKAYLFPGVLPIALALAALFSARTVRKEGGRPAARDRIPQRHRLLDYGIAALLFAALLIEASGGIAIGPFSASSGLRALVAALSVLGLRLAIFGRQPFALLGPLLAIRGGLRRFLEPRFGIHGGFYLLLAIFSFWASLGPDFGLYAALHRLVPGFDFVRVPSRFSVLLVLSLAILAGIAADKWRSAFAAPIAVVLVLFELAAFPLEVRAYRVAISPMDSWLARREPAPIAVFPVPDPRDGVEAARRHSLYMLQSTAHYFPMVNGYSGFTPPFHDRLFRRLSVFPSEEGLDELEEISVRWAVFHRDGYGEAEWEALLARLGSFAGRLELRAEFEEGRIYEIVTRDPRGRESSGASRSRRSSGLLGFGPGSRRPLPVRAGRGRWATSWR